MNQYLDTEAKPRWNQTFSGMWEYETVANSSKRWVYWDSMSVVFFSLLASFTLDWLVFLSNRSLFIFKFDVSFPICYHQSIHQTVFNSFIRFLPVSLKRFTQSMSATVDDLKSVRYLTKTLFNTDLQKKKIYN